ncbi:pyruvate formate lyase family protein, partial [Thermodesulfobacteriota bacterium]
EVSEAERVSLLQDAHYWKGKSASDAAARVRHEVYGQELDDLREARVTFGPEERPVSGRIPDHEKVMNKGLNGIIAEAKEGLQKLSFSDKDDLGKYYFLKAVIIACEGAIKFAHRYAELARELAGKESDTVRKKELEKIADICQWVPANPARSFYEALQCFWFIHLSDNLEGAYITDTPGRMDQYLYPFYKRDLEEGRLSRQEAAEQLGCLWVKLNEMEAIKSTLWKEAGQSSQFQNVTIGGVTSDGKDATNELTYLLMEISRQLKLTQPPLYLRCHKDTPIELFIKAVEVNRDRGDGQPAFLNDEPILLNFVAKGIPLQEARDWVGAGCIHTYVAHASYGDRASYFNNAKIFELTLNNGIDPNNGKQIGPATGDPRDFSSFNELYDASLRTTSRGLKNNRNKISLVISA